MCGKERKILLEEEVLLQGRISNCTRCWMLEILARNGAYYKGNSVKLAEAVSVMSYQHSYFCLKVYNIPLKCDSYLYSLGYLNLPHVG